MSPRIGWQSITEDHVRRSIMGLAASSNSVESFSPTIFLDRWEYCSPWGYSRSHKLSNNKVGLEAGLLTASLGLSFCFISYSSLFGLRNRRRIFLKASSPLPPCNLEAYFLIIAPPKWLFQFLLNVVLLYLYFLFLYDIVVMHIKKKLKF